MIGQVYHTSVMLEKSIEGLNIDPNGTYVDATFGGGGHSHEILSRLERGHLIAFDKDGDAQKNINVLNQSKLSAFKFIGSDFRHIKKHLQWHGIQKVDGMLADLGVSSYQINTPKRGFSVRFDENLDMRMNQNIVLDAKKVINSYPEKDIVHILSLYGEVRNAKTLAAALVHARSQQLITTSTALKNIAWKYAPRRREYKYISQVFQAFRIEVNDELGALKALLLQAKALISDAGRLVVISYHSLEDRIVKNFINKGNFENEDLKDFYGQQIRAFNPVNRKPITPSEIEIKDNSRARSAKLRIGQRKYVKQ